MCVKVGAGDPRLQNFRFKQVLVDESTQAGVRFFTTAVAFRFTTAIFYGRRWLFEATEPECLIPIMRGCPEIASIGHVYSSRIGLMK